MLYYPRRGLGQKAADWFGPVSGVSAHEDHYGIEFKLPDVKADDINVLIQDNNATACLRASSLSAEKRGVMSSFLSASMAHFCVLSDCRQMHPTTRLMQHSAMVY